MTPSQLASNVSQGVQLGLAVYPPAAPEVAVARDVVCADVAKTNVNPADIVMDLQKAGITSEQAKIIINGAVLIYNQVWTLLPNNDAAEPYLAALCAGLTAGLPPNRIVVKMPHLSR